MDLREPARLYVAVGLGAALGALLRMLSGLAAVAGFGLPAVWGTGFVNVVGSFIIAFFAIVTGPDGRFIVGPARRQFVMAGFCGGFTTFSSMSLETFGMLEHGDIGPAALYLALVIALSLAAAWFGYWLAVRYNR